MPGIVNFSFPLSDQPKLGTWKIVAEVQQQKYDYSFDVKKYGEAHSWSYTCAHKRTHTRTYTHTRIHTHTHTHTHTRTHNHLLVTDMTSLADIYLVLPTT